MKNKITVAWLIAGALAGFIDVSLAAPSSAAKPYTAITGRNVFGLVSISIEPTNTPPALSLPQIVPQGFATILGPEVVLFEVVDHAPDKAATKSLYVLKTGETRDGFTVEQINPAAGMITFDNHGTIQRIPLATAAGTEVGTGRRPMLGHSSAPGDSARRGQQFKDP
jgi:hypothetical protein